MILLGHEPRQEAEKEPLAHQTETVKTMRELRANPRDHIADLLYASPARTRAAPGGGFPARLGS